MNRKGLSLGRVARHSVSVTALCLPAVQVLAGGVPTVDPGAIQVTTDALPGRPLSASQGTIDRIPGAVERVASLGLLADHPSGWFGGARLRYLGSAPLIEDDSVRSEPTSLLHVSGGYRLNEAMSVEVSVFNVLDSRDNDITYFYESRLAGESEPTYDLHVHPVEPRTVRATVTLEF